MWMCSIKQTQLHMASHCTKCKVSSFSHSKAILEAKKIKIGHMVRPCFFRDDLSSHLLLWTCPPNLKSLCLPTMKIRNETQNVETGMVSDGSPKIIGNMTIWWTAYDFQFDYKRNCVYLVLFSSYSEFIGDVALVVVLWCPALLSASLTTLRWEPVNVRLIFGMRIGLDPG